VDQLTPFFLMGVDLGRLLKRTPLPWREGIEGRGNDLLVHPHLYPAPCLRPAGRGFAQAGIEGGGVIFA
jgi:hypothetical protein